jgi:HlyD family secretion protein
MKQSYKSRLAYFAQRLKPGGRAKALSLLFRKRHEEIQNPITPARRAISRLNRVGLTVCALLIFGFGGWAATASLSGAVIAPGTLVVESNIKKVQHPTGGVVGDILVREGQVVQAGEVLIRLDETITRAQLSIVAKQLVQLRVREARLRAEHNEAKILAFPENLVRQAQDSDVAEAMAGEMKLFEARRSAREGQKSQLAEQIAQLRQQIDGLNAQLTANQKEARLIGQELAGVEKLYRDNLVAINRYMSLAREETRLSGSKGQLIAEMARAKGKISEIELQILQIDQQVKADALTELREVQAKAGEFEERKITAEDQLKRIDIRAPQAGIIHQLAINTVGGVIGNGETLMNIVPKADALQVEAKITPNDIDQVHVGSKAIVKIMAGNQRTTPEINALVTRVSADLTREQQTGLTYYVVRLDLPMEEVKRLGDLQLVPGMPAESFIRTYDRTALQYFLKPLNDQLARTFRER